jgi:hypothetical protein
VLGEHALQQRLGQLRPASETVQRGKNIQHCEHVLVVGAQSLFADGKHLKKDGLGLGVAGLKEVGQRQLVERLGILETALGVPALDDSHQVLGKWQSIRMSAGAPQLGDLPGEGGWFIGWLRAGAGMDSQQRDHHTEAGNRGIAPDA